jgi:PAS domain S-box-containing protein
MSRQPHRDSERPAKAGKTPRDRSIARRLTVSLMLTVSVVSVVTVSTIYLATVRKARVELEQKADEIVAHQVGLLAIPLWDLDERSIKVIGKTIFQYDAVAELVIKNYLGQVVFTEKKDLGDTISRSVPIYHQNNFVGDVFVSLSKQFYQKDNRKLLWSFFVTICLILITLIVASGLLIRTFLRKPLDHLNEVVKAYAAGQYSASSRFQPYMEFRPFSRVLAQMGDQITEQMAALQQAEEKYRSIFENAIEGIFQSTPEGRFISANPSMAEILGYRSPADLIESVTDIATQLYSRPADRQRFSRLMNDGERVMDFEAQLRRKDGQFITGLISARAVQDADSHRIYYEGSLIDITRRKKASEALRETKEQLAMLLESLPIVSFTCMPEGDFRITFISSTIEEITGYRPEQFISDPGFWASKIAEDDRSKILGGLPRNLAADKCRFEYRFQAADGSFRWFDDTRRLVRTTDGALSHIAGMWRDITEEKRLRKEAEYRLQQVIQRDKLASLGVVVAGVAHEINNPNSFITYNVPLLEETWQIFQPILSRFSTQNPGWRHGAMDMAELCEDMNEILSAIRSGSDRINRIVMDLKEFVRIDKGPLRPVDINEVIEKTFVLVGAQVRKSVARWEINLGEKLPTVQGSFQKLEQVVMNLVVNALHAIPEKEKGRLLITTQHVQRLGANVIRIEDNGTGIEPGVVGRIFEPFFTSRREFGGTGLGLSVSYNLVREHNGIIRVLSKPDCGSRFTVFLPTDLHAKLDLRSVVLCFDADLALQKALTAHFIDSGDILLVIAETAEDMLERIENWPEAEIILADVGSLRVDKWRRLSLIKERFPLLTLILCIEPPEGVEEKPAEVPDPDHVLTKPIQMASLAEILLKSRRHRS